MKDTIPTFLKENFSNKNARPKYFTDDMKQYILDYGEFYNYPNDNELEDNQLLGLWFRYMKSGINEIGQCELDTRNQKKAITKLQGKNTFKVSDGCCWKHTNKISIRKKYGVDNVFQLDDVKNKSKETFIKTLNCENPSQSKIIKEKKKKTLIKNYGVDHNMKSDLLKNNRKLTYMRRYGVDNPMKNPKCIEKAKETSKLKYGCDYPSQSKSFKENLKKSLLIKYGVENVFQLQETKDKIISFNLKKYGEIHPMKNPEEFTKRQNIRFKLKEYIWKSGEISMVQGYEPIVLKELEEQGYIFNEILTSPEDMPKITYEFNGKTHTYFPDIFIPKDNIIIEVKSDYTLKANWDINQLKFEATKSLGFDFRLEVR